MKRFFAILLCAILLVSVMAVGASAANVDWESVELKALYVQSGADIFSDLDEDYFEYWWEEEVPELDNYYQACTINMRGFAMSADGRYCYMGTLNGGTGVRGVVVFDTQRAQVTDLYYQYDGEIGLSGSPFSYAKGIAADDRGYVYVGFAFSKNYNIVNLGIAKQQDDGTLEEVYYDAIYEFGAPGDEGGIKVGVNGVDVAKVGDSYYCYVMVNYDYDALYCIDVTDPANPKLNKDFGTDGRIEFSEPSNTVAGNGFTLKEGQYLDVDEDGTIWLVVNANESKDGIMKLAYDGSACVDVIEMSGIYSVEHVGAYLLCGAKDGSAITVLDDTSYETVATVPLTAEYGDRVVRMQVINDVLFVCDAGNDSNNDNAIHAAPLSANGQEFFDYLVSRLANPGQVETDAPADDTLAEDVTEDETLADDETAAATEETPVGDETAAATDAPVVEIPVGEETTAVETSKETAAEVTEGETAAATEAEATTASATEGETEAPKSGCGAVMGMAAVSVLTAAAAFVATKKKD